MKIHDLNPEQLEYYKHNSIFRKSIDTLIYGPQEEFVLPTVILDLVKIIDDQSKDLDKFYMKGLKP